MHVDYVRGDIINDYTSELLRRPSEGGKVRVQIGTAYWNGNAELELSELS